MCQVCARDITDTFVTAMYTVGDHILGTDLFRIEIYADQMCHVNVASVDQCVCFKFKGGPALSTYINL